VPILDACPSWFVGEILERGVLGDHTGFLLDPVAAHHGARADEQLRFGEAKSIEAGHAP
jgi:hypothetical protein